MRWNGAILIIVKKKTCGIAMVLFALQVSAVSCAKSPAITIELEEGKSNVYEYGESLHPLSLGIYQSGEFIRYVEEEDLVSFSTVTSQFDTPLQAKVNYGKASYPFTYQVSSLYDFDKTHYTVKLHSDASLEVTLIGNPSKSATEFVLPNQIDTLPGALKNWKVAYWSASFGAMNALKKVTLNPDLLSFTPLIDSSIEVVPGSGGHLTYDQSGFLSQNSVLWGLSSSLKGEVDLPNNCTSFVFNAFAGTHSGITSLHFPTTYADYSLLGVCDNLPDCCEFVLPTETQGYSTKEGFLYKKADSEVQCFGVPMGKKPSGNTLSLPEGLTRFLFDNLDGCVNETYQTLVLPSSLLSLSAKTAVTAPYLTGLKLLSPRVVDTTSLAIKYFATSLTKIEVPSSLLTSYQADDNWGKLASIFVGF